MHVSRGIKKLIAAVAALIIATVAGVVFAQSSQAATCVNPKNATASALGGTYKAIFKTYDEPLTVQDFVTDSYAAVAYVRVYKFLGCTDGGTVPVWSSSPVDEDRFVMTIGEKTYELGTPDGTGDIPENYLVKINVCRGYWSVSDGRDCSGWVNGIA